MTLKGGGKDKAQVILDGESGTILVKDKNIRIEVKEDGKVFVVGTDLVLVQGKNIAIEATDTVTINAKKLEAAKGGFKTKHITDLE